MYAGMILGKIFLDAAIECCHPLLRRERGRRSLMGLKYGSFEALSVVSLTSLKKDREEGS